jgi:hypothetical protein
MNQAFSSAKTGQFFRATSINKLTNLQRSVEVCEILLVPPVVEK